MPRPDLTVVGGPNGSGKSSVIRLLGEVGVDLVNYHNADDIGREFDVSSQEAQAFVRAQRDTAIRERQSFTYETVMSHMSHIEAMQEARAAGFFVRLIFVTTDDPDINVARVANRVALGGHDVPEASIRGRYRRAMRETLCPAIWASDEAMLFDNSHDGSATALRVAHVIGSLVRKFETPSLAWPDRYVWPVLSALDDVTIVPADR